MVESPRKDSCVKPQHSDHPWESRKTASLVSIERERECCSIIELEDLPFIRLVVDIWSDVWRVLLERENE